MPVLIDGNNLLYAALEHDPERPPSRTTLCAILGQWARKTGEKVAVVFDGPAPTKVRAQQIGDPDVAVRYSGGGVKADDVLTDVINEDSAPRRLIVVSTDREVAQAAKRRRAAAERADRFWAKVLNDLSRPPREELEPEEKKRGLKPRDVDAWLRDLDVGESP